MKKLFILMMVVVLAVVLSGCKSASEKAAEKVIESSTGGSVDVDIDKDTVAVNINGSSLQAGEEVSLPDGFPSDVHVISGTIKSALEVTASAVYQVTIETSKSVAAAKAEYESEFAKDGWTVTSSMDFGTGSSVMAEKDNRTASVSISEIEGQVTVVLTTSTSE